MFSLPAIAAVVFLWGGGSFQVGGIFLEILGSSRPTNQVLPRPRVEFSQIRLFHGDLQANGKEGGKLLWEGKGSSFVGSHVNWVPHSEILCAVSGSVLWFNLDGTLRLELEVGVGDNLPNGEYRQTCYKTTLAAKSGQQLTWVCGKAQNGNDVWMELVVKANRLVDRHKDLVPGLIGLLTKDEGQAQAMALATLEHLGLDAVPELLKALEAKDAPLRQKVACLLVSVTKSHGALPEEAIPALLKALKDDDPVVRHAIVILLDALVKAAR